MAPWLRYLMAFVVFAHGFVYVRIGWVLPGPITAWRGRSWLLSDTVTGDQLRRVVISLHVAAGIALLACAVAIAALGLVASQERVWSVTRLLDGRSAAAQSHSVASCCQ